MREIGNLDKLTFTNWGNITIGDKNITRKWGKTYFYVREKTLYYENLSWIKRIFYQIFFHKKVEQEKAKLWEYLKATQRVAMECPKNDFRQQVAKALQNKSEVPPIKSSGSGPAVQEKTKDANSPEKEVTSSSIKPSDSAPALERKTKNDAGAKEEIPTSLTKLTDSGPAMPRETKDANSPEKEVTSSSKKPSDSAPALERKTKNDAGAKEEVTSSSIKPTDSASALQEKTKNDTGTKEEVPTSTTKPTDSGPAVLGETKDANSPEKEVTSSSIKPSDSAPALQGKTKNDTAIKEEVPTSSLKLTNSVLAVPRDTKDDSPEKDVTSSSIKPTDSGPAMPGKIKDVSGSEEEILDTLTKCAKKEGDAFLIDFSKVNPSNIFKIFIKSSLYSKAYGDVAISDKIFYDESNKFTQNFPFKYSIGIVTLEKNVYGYANLSQYMFTMNDEGKVESYGKVFDNFDVYIEHLMNKKIYSNGKVNTFEHFDFFSTWTNKYKKLRKKAPTTDSK